MPRAPRRPKSAQSPPPTTRTTADATRGITAASVDRAADALLRAGHRPTIERVRAHLGRGSPNTINPLLDAWWQRLAGRLDAGPAALHRLPEPVLHAAEGLWLQTLDAARKRAASEQGSTRSALARDRRELEVRSHVLSIRESELADRLQLAERRTQALELELEALTTLLRKEQASRLAAERRLADSPNVRVGGVGRAPQPTAAAARAKSRTKSRKPGAKSPRAKAARPRRPQSNPPARRSRPRAAAPKRNPTARTGRRHPPGAAKPTTQGKRR